MKKKIFVLICSQLFIGSLILASVISTSNTNMLSGTSIQHNNPEIGISAANISLLWTDYRGDSINKVDMSADGVHIVSGDQNQNVTCFNSSHGYLWNYTCGGIVNDVAISSDGQYIVSGDTGDNVTLLASNGTLLGSYDTGTNVTSVAISNDGGYFVAGTLGGLVILFNSVGGILNYMWNYSTGSSVRDVAMSATGISFVAGDDNNFTIFTSMGGGMYIDHNDTVGITSVAIAESGMFAIAGSSSSSILYAYDLTAIPPGNYWWGYDTGGLITCVDTSGGYGIYTIVGNTNNITRVYGYGSYLWHYDTGVVQSAKISGNARYIISGDDANNITYTSDNEVLWNYTATTPINTVAISDDGLYFAAGDENGTVYLGFHKLAVNVTPPPDPTPLILWLEMGSANRTNNPFMLTIIGIGVATVIIYVNIRKGDEDR